MRVMLRCFFVLGFISILAACAEDKNAKFFVKNVVGETQLRQGNSSTFTFNISATVDMTAAVLTFSLLEKGGNPRQYFVGASSVNLSRAGTDNLVNINVPPQIPDGNYELRVAIDPDQIVQDVIRAPNSLSFKTVSLLAPTNPQVSIQTLRLSNNSFVLSAQRPDDASALLTNRGELQLTARLAAEHLSLTDDITFSFDLELDGLGTYELSTTSEVAVKAPASGVNHRQVNADGKTIERIKGASRQIKPICIDSASVPICTIVHKNSRRQLKFDLHINELLYDTLKNNATGDINGNIVMTIDSTAPLADTTYQIPVIFLHQGSSPTQLAAYTSGEDPQKAASTSNVDEMQNFASGDSGYLSYSTSSNATTFLDSSGNATSSQSQKITAEMANGYQTDDGDNRSVETEDYNVANISTSVIAGQGDDIENTQVAITLDAMGGTVFDFTDNINDQALASSSASPAVIANYSAAKSTELNGSSYNPQDEMVWIFCSNQNSKCDINDRGLTASTQVRYGDPESDRWHYKQITSFSTCDDSHWGDPAPGAKKICEYLVPPSFAPVWERCAIAVGNCVGINGPTTVRYGRDERWLSNNFDKDFVCDNGPQGGNPYQGSTKVCEKLIDFGAPPLNYEWVHCANEKQTCEFDGSVVARNITQDNGSVYTMFSVRREPFVCKSSVMGEPHDGYPKTCEYLKYIDPNSRQDQTNLVWSSKSVDREGNFSNAEVGEPIDEEKVLVEVEFSKGMHMATFWGIVFEASVTVQGEVGLKLNGYLDKSQKTFTLVGGPYVNLNSEAKGSGRDAAGFVEVGITAPISVLDISSPFTIAFNVKPKVLTAEISLDYFMDFMSGNVAVYYDYDFIGLVSDYDIENIYSWSSLYQTSGNLFQGAKTWEIEPVTNYILPAVQDAFYQVKIGYDTMLPARDYFLEVQGTITNNGTWDPTQPNEYVDIDVVCAGKVVASMQFSGEVDEVIPLLECAEVNISGIRPPNWPDGHRLTFGVRER